MNWLLKFFDSSKKEKVQEKSEATRPFIKLPKQDPMSELTLHEWKTWADDNHLITFDGKNTYHFDHAKLTPHQLDRLVLHLGIVFDHLGLARLSIVSDEPRYWMMFPHIREMLFDKNKQYTDCYYQTFKNRDKESSSLMEIHRRRDKELDMVCQHYLDMLSFLLKLIKSLRTNKTDQVDLHQCLPTYDMHFVLSMMLYSPYYVIKFLSRAPLIKLQKVFKITLADYQKQLTYGSIPFHQRNKVISKSLHLKTVAKNIGFKLDQDITEMTDVSDIELDRQMLKYFLFYHNLGRVNGRRTLRIRQMADMPVISDEERDDFFLKVLKDIGSVDRPTTVLNSKGWEEDILYHFNKMEEDILKEQQGEVKIPDPLTP